METTIQQPTTPITLPTTHTSRCEIVEVEQEILIGGEKWYVLSRLTENGYDFIWAIKDEKHTKQFVKHTNRHTFMDATGITIDQFIQIKQNAYDIAL